MGIFDFFTAGGAMKRHVRRVTDRDAQDDDRVASIQWLAENGSPEAVAGLCNRFGMQLEHQLKDRKEKDMVLEALCEKGAEGAQIAKDWAHRNTRFAYAVKVVERVEGAAAAVDLLLAMLAKESVDNELKPEKKHALLIALAERKDPRVADAARPFLADFNEGVRHAAIEAIAAQDGDAGRDGLTGALLNPKEESTRIRGRLAEIFAQRRWPVPEDGWLAQNTPTGFRLEAGRLVR
ncbi:MAG: HEAT repeat domain-containing protein [Myxococcota bacterium]